MSNQRAELSRLALITAVIGLLAILTAARWLSGGNPAPVADWLVLGTGILLVLSSAYLFVKSRAD